MEIKSKYIFEKNIGDKLFLLNLLTFVYIILDINDRTLWEKSKLAHMSNFDQLKREYFIVDNDSYLIDYAFKTLAKKGNLNPNHVIYITDECNQSCTYCFESSIGILGKKKKTLSTEQVNKIFDTISKLNKNEKKQGTITLFGGEPLLDKNRDIIENILSQVKERCFQKVDIVTNGLTLNNYENLIQLFRLQIGTLILTLNGYKETHDSARGSLGRPTFDRIIGNIKHFLAYTNGVNIRLNLMLDKTNVGKMLPLLSYLKAENISTDERVSLEFGRIQFRVNPGNINFENELPYEDYYPSIFNYYYNNELFTDKMICGSEVSIISKMYKFWKNNRLVYPELKGCSAVYPGRLCYFVDDNIYPCTEITGIEKFSIGNYMQHGIDAFKYEPWSNYKVQELDKCKDCKYIGLCNGACPVSNITSNGQLDDIYCLKMEESLSKFIDTLYTKGFFDDQN